MRRLVYIATLVLLSPLMQAQAEYEVLPVSKINTSYNEFAPRMHNNGVLFCSNKKDEIFISYLNHESGDPLTRIYFAEQNKNGRFRTETPLQFEENQRIDFGPFDIFQDSLLAFTRSYVEDKKPALGIFFSNPTGDRWSAPQPFEHNRNGYMVGHPAFSPDGRRIYFSANFEDSHGKADLYYCQRTGTGWSEPINLGSQINSAHSELFPFIHADGALYFSSDRPDGFGGFDIYRIADPFFPEAPQLLSAPFNSTENDFSYTANADDSQGFFSSNRNGSDDIFEFKLTRPHFASCDTLQINAYCYVFSDEANIYLDTLPLRYEWDFGDGIKMQGIEAEHCYQQPGVYHVALNIIDTLTGDLFFSQAQYELEVSDIKQVYIELPDTVGVNTPIFMHSHNTYLPGFEIDSHHWFLPGNQYAEEAEIHFTFSETGQFTIQLGLRSQPDSREIRQQACVVRSVVVVEEELLPVASAQNIARSGGDQNNDKDIFGYLMAHSDTITLNNIFPDETLFRVEIKKSKQRISTLDQFFDEVRGTYEVHENFIPTDSTFSYAVGEEKELVNTYPIYSDIKLMKYDEVRVKAYLSQYVYDLDSLDQISVEDIDNVIFRTGSIYFESDEVALMPEAHTTLNKIVHLLNQFPTLIIEVGAHTDNVGDETYNQHLSKERATSVINYLVRHNIHASRLIGVGYGTAFPIADNSNEEERQQNRRVEFKVISTH